jgi:hypothetical protein
MITLAFGSVRFGSKGDISAVVIYVRFTAESGHPNALIDDLVNLCS